MSVSEAEVLPTGEGHIADYHLHDALQAACEQYRREHPEPQERVMRQIVDDVLEALWRGK